MGAHDEVPLGDLCQVSAGPSGTLLDGVHEAGDQPGGIPVVTPSDITERGTIATRNLKWVANEAAGKWQRFALQPDDLLVVRQGALGRVALVGPGANGWFYGSSCLRLRVFNRDVIPAYLFHCLRHPRVRAAVAAQANPGTMPSLNSSIMADFRIHVPPMDVQRAVVETLTDIEEQIAIQLRMVDRLESLRPAVFERLVQGGAAR